MKLQECHWSVYFLFWTSAVVVLGGATGALGFTLLGPLFESNQPPLRHAIAGARHLGFIALIWAPGIALVLCVMRAYRNNQKR